jgi:hypothetical protein
MNIKGRVALVTGSIALGIIIPIGGAFIIPSIMWNRHRNKLQVIHPEPQERPKYIRRTKSLETPVAKAPQAHPKSTSVPVELDAKLPKCEQRKFIENFIDMKMVEFLSPFIQGKPPSPDRPEVKTWLIPIVRENFSKSHITDAKILEIALRTIGREGVRNGFCRSKRLTTDYNELIEKIQKSLAVDFKSLNLSESDAERLAQTFLEKEGALAPSHLEISENPIVLTTGLYSETKVFPERDVPLRTFLQAKLHSSHQPIVPPRTTIYNNPV